MLKHIAHQQLLAQNYLSLIEKSHNKNLKLDGTTCRHLSQSYILPITTESFMKSIILLCATFYASLSVAQSSCYTDNLGNTTCSDGSSAYTDSLGNTTFSDGTNAYTDKLGNTTYSDGTSSNTDSLGNTTYSNGTSSYTDSLGNTTFSDGTSCYTDSLGNTTCN